MHVLLVYVKIARPAGRVVAVVAGEGVSFVYSCGVDPSSTRQLLFPLPLWIKLLSNKIKWPDESTTSFAVIDFKSDI